MSAAAVTDPQAIAEWIEQDRGIGTANCVGRAFF